MFVYGHYNKITKKWYIGQTEQILERRFKNGNGYKYNEKFYNDIELYGWDSFDHIILFESDSYEECDIKEKEFIIKYDSFKNGYNNGPGGKSKVILSEEQRKKLSEIHKKISCDHLHTKEMQEKIKKTIQEKKKREFEALPEEEKTRIIEKRKKTEERKKYRENNKVPVIQMDMNGNYIKTFPSILAAAQEVDCNPSRIKRVITGERKSTHGFKWRYKNEELTEKYKINENKLHGKFQQVAKLDEEGNIIDIYISAAEAARLHNIKNPFTITGVCSGKYGSRRSTAAGYKWKYITQEEYLKLKEVLNNGK